MSETQQNVYQKQVWSHGDVLTAKQINDISATVQDNQQVVRNVVNNSLPEINTNIESVVAEVATKSSNQRVEQLEGIVGNITEQLTTKPSQEQVTSDIGTAVEALNKSISDVSEQFNAKLEGFVKLDENTERYKQTIDNFAEYIKEHSLEDVNSIVDGIASNTNTIDELKVDVEANATALEDKATKQEIEQTNVAVSAIDNDVKALQNELQLVPHYQVVDGRKMIFLANHDNILGYATNGQPYNIAMVSKWDKVDVGTAHLQLNLNSLNSKVTVNDVDDNWLASIQEVNTNINNAIASYGAEVDSKINNIVVDHDNDISGFRSEINEAIATKVEVDAFNTLTQTVEQVEGDLDVVKGELRATSTHIDQDIQNISDHITDINSKYDERVNKIDQEIDDTKAQITALNQKTSDPVNFSSFQNPSDPQPRKTIQLANFDSISGIGNNCLDGELSGYPGGEDLSNQGFNLAMVSRWNVADFGSSKIHLNLNTKDKVTINDDQVVVVENDLEAIQTTVNEAIANIPVIVDQSQDPIIQQLAAIKEQIANLNFVTRELGSNTKLEVLQDFSDTNANVLISDSDSTGAGIFTVNANNATMTNVATADSKVIINATNNVMITDYANSGNLPKATSKAALAINSDGFVQVNGVDWQQTGYNAIEVGLAANSSAKDIRIENATFSAKMNNNAISIFDIADGGTITIKNCHFEEVSNPIRISNKTGKKATIRVIDCTVGAWASDPTYAKFVLFQDYTNLPTQFANTTLEFENCKGPGNVAITRDNAYYVWMNNPSDNLTNPIVEPKYQPRLVINGEEV